MSMYLFYAASSTPSSSTSTRELRLLCAYEDGGVVLRKRTVSDNTKTIEGRGWEVLWKSKLHVESGSLKHETILYGNLTSVSC